MLQKACSFPPFHIEQGYLLYRWLWIQSILLHFEVKRKEMVKKKNNKVLLYYDWPAIMHFTNLNPQNVACFQDIASIVSGYRLRSHYEFPYIYDLDKFYI